MVGGYRGQIKPAGERETGPIPEGEPSRPGDWLKPACSERIIDVEWHGGHLREQRAEERGGVATVASENSGGFPDVRSAHARAGGDAFGDGLGAGLGV